MKFAEISLVYKFFGKGGGQKCSTLRLGASSYYFLTLFQCETAQCWPGALIRVRKVMGAEIMTTRDGWSKYKPPSWRDYSGHCPAADTCIVTGRITDIIVRLFNDAGQINSWCGCCVNIETRVTLRNMLIRPTGTKAIYSSLWRCRCFWSRDSSPRSLNIK
jgi:hypothetical protein